MTDKTLPDGYRLTVRDDAARLRKMHKGRSTSGTVKATKKGGKPWSGPWRWHEQDAISDAVAHARRNT